MTFILIWLYLSASLAAVVDFATGKHWPKDLGVQIYSAVIVAIIGPLILPALACLLVFNSFPGKGKD